MKIAIFHNFLDNISGGKRDKMKFISAVWFISMTCNFDCPYCHEAQNQKNGKPSLIGFIDSERWIEAWNRLNPNVLDITGGEPFLQPGFMELLNKLNGNIKIAITTNLSNDLTNFVQKISPKKVFSITCSFHPTSKIINTEMFIGKCLLLKNRGFNISVNFVGYPEQMWLIPKYKKMFNKHNIKFHLNPYIATPYNPYIFSDKEIRFLKKYTKKDRSNFFDIKKYPVLCSAGYNHINVQPNGDVYRCIVEKAKGFKMGNIFDPNFKLEKKWNYCESFYCCSGCDRDKVRIKKYYANK
jgi:radical SAM protein with 4Fe4S-binding SPASM domain